MSEPIKVGDLVELRTSCCSLAAPHHGMYGVAVAVSSFEPTRCPECGFNSGSVPTARVPDIVIENLTPNAGWFPQSWLRKVPPFPELADEKVDDRIPELVLK